MCHVERAFMASDYNHLDDVPMSVRHNLAQGSPAFSIITDSHSPEGVPQSQVMSPNAPSISLLTSTPAAAASTEMIQLRFQQMLQMQAPADLIRMLQSGQGVNAEAKTAKDVQSNVNKVAMELEYRTEKLAACVTTLTGDMEGVKQQHGILIEATRNLQSVSGTVEGTLQSVTERVQHLETAIAHISRQQVSLESTLAIRVETMENQIKAALLQQAQGQPVDALADEIGSMKSIISRLESKQEESERRSRSKIEELAKSILLGNERAMDADTRLKLALERIVGNERLCEKLRKADADLEAQIQQLAEHLEEESYSTKQRTAAEDSEDKTQGDEETPRATKQPAEFKMTPNMDDVTWQKDETSEWFEEDRVEIAAAAVLQGARPRLGISSSPPGLPKHLKKTVDIPSSAWKLLKEMPKLNTTSSEAWEKGMAFRQWTTEMAAIAEAIHPSFAEYFRSKLSEGQSRYEKRLDQGYAEPIAGVRVEDKEMETRLSLALLRVIPAKMKAHALEGGTTEEGISTAQLMEAVCEHMAPGGVRERSSLFQYLRAPPPANNGEELMNTLRRFRLAQQRAVHLGIPTQPAHELVAALDAMVRPLERKHQPLSVRLGILRLQANIQLPTADGVELYAKILETEGIKLQAEEVTKPKGGRADSQFASEEYTVPSASQAESGGKGGGKKGVRVCAYYNSARGCLKGAECEYRHEDPQPKGKGTKGGKDAKGTEKGKPSVEPRADAKAKAKATAAAAKAEAKAAAKAEAKAAAEAEAKAEAKRKAKADKKAAKAAAKAATVSATDSAAASVTAEAIPFLAGASSGPSSSTSYRVMVSRGLEEESEGSEDDEGEIPSLPGADSVSMVLSSSGDDVIEGGEIPTDAQASTPEWSDVEQGQFPSPATTPRSAARLSSLVIGNIPPRYGCWT